MDGQQNFERILVRLHFNTGLFEGGELRLFLEAAFQFLLLFQRLALLLFPSRLHSPEDADDGTRNAQYRRMSTLPHGPSANGSQSNGAFHAPASTGIDRNLGISVREDSEAMQDDLHKAAEVTAFLEGALAGKSREVAHLKRLLEASSARFKHLQETITAIRNERHSLANRAMRVVGLESALNQMTMERDRLKLERDGVLEALADEAAGKHLLRFDKSHVQIVELTVQVVKLKDELAEAKHELDRYKRTSNLKTAVSENFWLGTE
jgi:hypothetical protein